MWHFKFVTLCCKWSLTIGLRQFEIKITSFYVRVPANKALLEIFEVLDRWRSLKQSNMRLVWSPGSRFVSSRNAPPEKRRVA